MNNKKKIIEWGEEPEKDMKLIGFSCEAIIEGKELKDKIFEYLKEGELGFRKAVSYLKESTLCSFDQAVEIITKMKKDTMSIAYGKKYKYVLNRVFWGYEQDMPKNDPRYFVLNIIDCKHIDNNKYLDNSKTFDAESFIKENIKDEDLIKNKLMKKGISITEIDNV